jgi:predicted transcriptional regulator
MKFVAGSSAELEAPAVGEQRVDPGSDPRELRILMRRLLNDIHALDKMMAAGMIESGVRRIGAVQEWLISCFEVLRQLVRNISEGADQSVPVGAIMVRDPLTVPPETSTLDAISLMRREKIDCLPVVKDGRLVGIVTERDFIGLAARLLEQGPAKSKSSASTSGAG